MKVNVEAILRRDDELRKLDKTATDIEDGAHDLMEAVSTFQGD